MLKEVLVQEVPLFLMVMKNLFIFKIPSICFGPKTQKMLSNFCITGSIR